MNMQFSIAGNLFMAFGNSHNRTDSLIVAGYALIAFGGMGVLVSTTQLSFLFAKPSVYMGLFLSAFGCSGTLLFKKR